MTKNEFLSILNQRGIDRSIIRWEDSVSDDVFCVFPQNGAWRVYYQERGKHFCEMTFPTESDALDYLMTQLL